MSRKTRKLIWSAPLVAVFAVVGALALFMALAPNAALAHEPPGPVTSLAATPDGYDTIKLSWGAPSTGGTLTGYRIDVSEDTYEWDPLVANTGNTRTAYTHEGLKPESERFYRVFALNAAGAGPSPVVKDQLFASATTSEAQAPSVVLNLRAAASGSSKVVLTWSPPADNGGAEIDRYCIIADGDGDLDTDDPWPMDTDPGNCANETSAPLDDERAITELKGGLVAVSGKKTTFEHKAQVSTAQTWRYRVYAINSANEAEANSDNVRYSNIARARTAGQSTLGKPTDLRIAPTDVNYGDIRLYWNWPKVDNKADTTVTAFQYQFRVKNAGESWPAYATATPEIPAPVPPGNELYQASQASLGTFDAEGDQIRFRVRSVKGTGITAETSRWTESSAITHQGTDNVGVDEDDDLYNKVLLTGTPTNLNADIEQSLNSINLTWEKNDDKTARASYIDMALDSQVTETGPKLWIRLAGNTSYTRETYGHIRLKPGQMIHYRITPWHSRGFGIAAETMGSTKTAYEPQAVRGLSVAADGQDKLTLSWTRTPASDNGGSAVLGYLVQVANDYDDNATLDLTSLSIATSGDWLNVDTTIVSEATVTDGAGGGSYTYTSEDDDLTLGEGLSAGSTRWFRVFAINSKNKSGPSTNDQQSAVWEDGTTAGPSVPGAPRYLVAETARDSNGIELTERGVVLLWDAPLISAGDEIRGYVIERSVDGGAWTELKSTVDGTDGSYTDYTDTEEPMATELRGYRVRAVTKGGTSLWSDVAYYPHGLAMHGTAPTAGAAIADQTVMAGATVMVQSTITDADAGDTLMWSVMSDMPMYATAAVDNMGMVTITGVAAGMATITVTATDMDDAYAMQTIMVTVEAAEPEEVGPATSVTTGPFNVGGVIQVNWDAAPNATGYIIYAVNVDELDDANGQIVVAPVNDAAAETYNLGGLKSGDTYDIYVVATAKEMVEWPTSADVQQVTAN